MKTRINTLVQDEPAGIATSPAHRPIQINNDEQHSALSRSLAPTSTALRCPHCDSIVYSRRHKLCGVCAEELPAEFLFTTEVSARIKGLLREEQNKHRCWMTKSLHDSASVAFLAS